MIIMLILTVLLYISSILMVVLVLLQPHKSDGISIGSTESTIFGVSVDGGPLSRMTAFVAVGMAFIILGMHYFAWRLEEPKIFMDLKRDFLVK